MTPSPKIEQGVNQAESLSLKFIPLCVLMFRMAIAEQVLLKKLKSLNDLQKESNKTENEEGAQQTINKTETEDNSQQEIIQTHLAHLNELRASIQFEVIGSSYSRKTYDSNKFSKLKGIDPFAPKGKTQNDQPLFAFDATMAKQIAWFENLCKKESAYNDLTLKEKDIIQTAGNFQNTFYEMFINEANFVFACNQQLQVEKLQQLAKNYVNNNKGTSASSLVQEAEDFCKFLELYSRIKNNLGNQQAVHVFSSAYSGAIVLFTNLLDVFESVGFSENLSGPMRLVAKEYKKQIKFIDKLKAAYPKDENLWEGLNILIKPIQRIGQYLLTFDQIGNNFLKIYDYLPPKEMQRIPAAKLNSVKDTIKKLNEEINRTQDKDFTVTQSSVFAREHPKHAEAYYFLCSVQANLNLFYEKAKKAQSVGGAWANSYSWKDFFKNVFTKRKLDRTEKIIKSLQSATSTLANKFQNKEALNNDSIPNISQLLKGAIDIINKERKQKLLPRFFQPRSTVKNRLKAALLAWETSQSAYSKRESVIIKT